jgi:hypothetical protein
MITLSYCDLTSALRTANRLQFPLYQVTSRRLSCCCWVVNLTPAYCRESSSKRRQLCSLLSAVEPLVAMTIPTALTIIDMRRNPLPIPGVIISFAPESIVGDTSAEGSLPKV